MSPYKKKGGGRQRDSLLIAEQEVAYPFLSWTILVLVPAVSKKVLETLSWCAKDCSRQDKETPFCVMTGGSTGERLA